MSKRGAALTAILFAVMFSVSIFTARIAKAATTGSVTCSVLNVRSGPGVGYSKITTIKQGQTYPVITSQSGWHKLQIGTKTGWVSGDYLKLIVTKPAPVNSTPAPKPSPSPTPVPVQSNALGKVKVTADLLNVRQGATTSSNKIGGVKMGETFQYFEKSGQWFKIKYGSSYGWVSGSYVATITDEDIAPPPAQPQQPQPQQPQQPQPEQPNEPEKPQNSEVTILPGDTVTANINLLSVRSDKSLDSSIIGRAKKGSTYTVLESDSGWLKIQFESGTGWIRSIYVTVASSRPAAPTEQPQTPGGSNNGGISAGEVVTVNIGLLTVRTDKSVDSQIVGRAKKGSTYTVLESAPGWIKIQFDSQTGWVRDQYVTSNNNTSSPVQPDLDTLSQIDSIKVYNTANKSSIAIPVTVKVGINSGISTFNPGITHSKDQNGRIVITVNNSVYNGYDDYFDVYNNLVSRVEIVKQSQNATRIVINPNSSVSYNVENVSTKITQDSEYRYIKAYVVVNIKDANSQNGTVKPGMEKNSQGKVKGQYLIALDAGHGGSTTGAVNGGLREKDLVYDIILRTNDILKAQGFDTYLTRDGDKYVSLSERADSANILRTDIFVSVHLNSFSSTTPNGTETLYNAQAVKPGATLAQYIQNHLVSALGRTNRGIVNRPDLAVLNSTHMPAALAELLFMSNPAEMELIKRDDIKQKAAQAIADGINQYFGFSY